MAAISGVGLSDRQEQSGAPFPPPRQPGGDDQRRDRATLASVGPDRISFQVLVAPTAS
jgi:hypothetical protein